MTQATSRGNLLRLRRRVLDVVPVDVLQRDLREPLPPLKAIDGGEIRRIDPAMSEDWRHLMPEGRWEDIERFKERGDYGHVALVGGSVVGEIWVSLVSHRDPWSGIELHLAHNEAYLYAMNVEPPYRRLGVAAALVAAALAALREGGAVERAYGWVDKRNRQSQVLLRVVFGFRQLQTVTRIRALGVGFQLPRSDRPRFGPASRVGYHSGATPELPTTAE